MYKKRMRPAIAMIELIFALVIMGIVLMSAPMLISTASKSSYVATQQEAINEAAAQLNMILSYHWDEQDSNESYPDPILIVDSTTPNLNVSGTSGRRKGTPKESFRAFVREDGKQNIHATSTLGIEGTVINDIDDFANTNVSLVLSGTGKAGNVETTTVNINRIVAYLNDDTNNPGGGYNYADIDYAPTALPATSTNIKAVTVTVTSTSGVSELNKTIRLSAFACNIGGYKLEELDMP